MIIRGNRGSDVMRKLMILAIFTTILGCGTDSSTTTTTTTAVLAQIEFDGFPTVASVTSTTASINCPGAIAENTNVGPPSGWVLNLYRVVPNSGALEDSDTLVSTVTGFSTASPFVDSGPLTASTSYVYYFVVTDPVTGSSAYSEPVTVMTSP
jgi:hypothetical protein